MPAVDILGGKVVRLEKGQFDRVKVYSDSPVEFARQWQEQGAQFLHVVDLDGARTGELKNFGVVQRIVSELSVKVEVGGGVRTMESVRRYLDAGVTRIVLGTRVIEDPMFLRDPVITQNLTRIAVSLDVKDLQGRTDSARLTSSGWEKEKTFDLARFLKEILSAGVRYINFSDISRDGMLSGLDSLGIRIFVSAVRHSLEEKIFLTYAGGVSCVEDIRQLAALGSDGVDAVIVGRALYEDRFSLAQAMAAGTSVS